jgi:hypothetical protein
VRCFLSEVISPKVPNWSPDSYTTAFSNIDSNSPRNLTSKVLERSEALTHIWLCAMGHCDKFGCALWATAANLVIRYGPLWWIWLYTMGHCGGFGYALWATVVDLVIRYGPLWWIWLCAMGHCGGFGYALWATVVDLVMRYGPLCGMRSYIKNL